ncbi:hypothetical protein ACEWBM_22095 [Vibrio parahaemolyticus]
MAEWKVTLAVSGPITVEQTTRFNAQKGTENPFWTRMKVTSVQHGVKIELVARADNQSEANEAALYFAGQALDYLCLSIDLPLYVSLTGTQFRPLDDNVKRILSTRDWITCFERAREVNENRRIFARSISWYRKGMVIEDPIDSFLSYWSSIECIGSRFGEVSGRQNGVINKICNCFDQMWGECSSWKAIPNDANKVNEFHDLRNGIAHGFISVDIDTLKRINHKLPIIKELSKSFLADWEERGTAQEQST